MKVGWCIRCPLVSINLFGRAGRRITQANISAATAANISANNSAIMQMKRDLKRGFLSPDGKKRSVFNSEWSFAIPVKEKQVFAEVCVPNAFYTNGTLRKEYECSQQGQSAFNDFLMLF